MTILFGQLIVIFVEGFRRIELKKERFSGQLYCNFENEKWIIMGRRTDGIRV